MPRRPRKNTTMDQFLTKPARDVEKAEAQSSEGPAAATADAAAGSVDPQQDRTPSKKRRTSTAPRTLAPQRRLQLDDSATASAAQPLSSSIAASSGDKDVLDSPPASATRKPPPLTAEQERVLKDFDLRSRFGAAAGVDRLVRWERAYRLGLKPPDTVKEILLEYADVPEARRCVLDIHLLRYDPCGDGGIRC